LLDGPLDLGFDEVARWVSEAARGVADFFGRPPARRTLVVLAPPPDAHGIPFGKMLVNCLQHDCAAEQTPLGFLTAPRGSGHRECARRLAQFSVARAALGGHFSTARPLLTVCP
jgi:hypothetical protein